jgi:hypothetical protein
MQCMKLKKINSYKMNCRIESSFDRRNESTVLEESLEVTWEVTPIVGNTYYLIIASYNTNSVAWRP